MFFSNSNDQKKKRTKNLIFEYQKHTDEEATLKPGISVDPEQSQESEEPQTNLTDPEIKVEMTDEPMPSTSAAISERSENVEEINLEINTVPVDITDRLGVEEKIDLYKAVFLDSSEDEDEEKTEKEETKAETKIDKVEEFKSLVLSEDLLPKIKPLKEGILSNVDFGSFNKNKNVPEDYTAQTEAETQPSIDDPIPIDLLSYGPRLPVKKDVDQHSTTDMKDVVSSDNEDEWVEKDECVKKKKSKHKKNKKEKHKKHKHKKNKH